MDLDFFILIVSFVIWLTPFFPLLSEALFEELESPEHIESRRIRSVNEICGIIGILYAAGVVLWAVIFWKLGLYDDPSRIWKADVPVFALASLTPIYSFSKWLKLQR